jgi:hypothetical protein
VIRWSCAPAAPAFTAVLDIFERTLNVPSRLVTPEASQEARRGTLVGGAESKSIVRHSCGPGILARVLSESGTIAVRHAATGRAAHDARARARPLRLKQ